MERLKIIFSIFFTGLSIACLIAPNYIPIVIVPKVWLVWSGVKLWMVRFNGETMGFPIKELKKAAFKKTELISTLRLTDLILVVISSGILYLIIKF